MQIIPQSYIAVDIGSSSIKMLELQGRTSKSLASIGLQIIPEGIVSEEGIGDDSLVSEILKEMCTKMNIAPFGRSVALSLNSTIGNIFKVYVDTTTELLEDIIPFVAEQHFQDDMANIYYKYYPLSPEVQDNPCCEVLLVGANREHIDQRINILNSIGFKVAVIDSDICCLSNILEYNYDVQNSNTILINIGFNVSQLILLQNGKYVYSKEIKFGSASYTKNIMDNMDTNFENAEILKLSASVSDNDTVKNIISTLNEQLCVEIQDVISTFINESLSQTKNDCPTQFDQIFILGGGSKALNLDNCMASVFKLPVKSLNPFNRIAVNESKFDIKYLIDQGHNFGVACGLALRSKTF